MSDWKTTLVERATSTPAFAFYIVLLSAVAGALDLGILHTVNTEFIRLATALKGCG